MPDARSLAPRTATRWSLWFVGQSVQPSDGSPLRTGGAPSILTSSVRAVSSLPAASVAEKLTLVTPAAATPNEAECPGTTVSAPVCAPANEYRSPSTHPGGVSFRPLARSVASRPTVTAAWFHPFAFGDGLTVAVVTGSMASE
jgi:hypothetical protein